MLNSAIVTQWRKGQQWRPMGGALGRIRHTNIMAEGQHNGGLWAEPRWNSAIQDNGGSHYNGGLWAEPRKVGGSLNLMAEALAEAFYHSGRCHT
jgi:hypothetical protein